MKFEGGGPAAHRLNDLSITSGHDTQPDDDVRWMTTFSIRRTGSNDDYQAQDLPYAKYPSRAGVVYRAGTEVGGRRCPWCSAYIVARSRVARLSRPNKGKWWVHERCYSKIKLDLRDCADCGAA